MSKKYSELRQILNDAQAHIEPLNMNGLQGRLMKVPASGKLKNEILFVYGHHTNLERVHSIALALSDFGNVVTPDLPGSGGMESLDKLGIKPSLDSMADYLASFIKLRYRRKKEKKIIIVGFSLGFVVATRMLQRYPEMADRFVLVSLMGFMHKNDLRIPTPWRYFFTMSSRVFSGRFMSQLFYNIALHPSLIRLLYRHTHNAKVKYADLSKEDISELTNFEVKLWRDDDTRTYMKMGYEMMRLDNLDVKINAPVHHIYTHGDQYFDNNVVEQNMRVIFSEYTGHEMKLDKHAPVIITSKKEAKKIIPASVRKKVFGAK